jgi:hypothetical protein
VYPLLIAAFVGQAPKDFPEFNYPAEVLRDGFEHRPLLSYCRTQALAAIKEAGGLPDLTAEEARCVRWRASVPTGHRPDFYASRLELFVNEGDWADNNLKLVYSAPLCGPEFAALPLVLRLGIEMLIRKECKGADPE